MTTASTDGARSHARSQASAASMRVPALPDGVDNARLVWAEAVPAESYVSRVLGRGTRLRLSDPDGGACAHLLLFRADASWERLNVADTMKVPWQAYLGVGHPLLSDQGRLLATIVADSSGRHDLLCGLPPAGQQKMLLAVIKHGMDIRDIAPSATLFKGVRVEDSGALTFTGSAGPGAAVELLIHLPVVVAVVNTAHPLDPQPATTGLDIVAWRADDELSIPINTDPEYYRALFNTESTWAAAQ
ncbi:Urea carboxylase-associated protein 2 [uncultured Mycobacterium sp.]|uniref:Urea carboxylase-associated protein 2 n=1 Tax=uncultured Mycobacterium sp. TaxID=171292 RepID=A0A1Y5PGT4_9MYCO|nr:Urea carboxylase-associated protein 2 [uncultured Mycobacterium sp.]